MAASGLSKAEYLRRRYLESGAAEAGKKRRRKKREAAGGRMRIVDDDDVSWKGRPAEEEEEDDGEGDESNLPVVAEFIDERPAEVKWMETFRASNKWKLLGDQNEEPQLFGRSMTTASISLETSKQNEKKHLLDQSSPRGGCHAQPDLPPQRPLSAGGKNHVQSLSGSQHELLSDELSTRQKSKAASDALPPCEKPGSAEGDLLLPEKGLSSRTSQRPQPTAASPRKRQRHDSESISGSPPTRRNAKASSDSDLSPPRATGRAGTQRPSSPSDLSPPRRNWHKTSDSDLSPPRRGPEAKKKGHKSRSSSTVLLCHQTMESNGNSRRMLSGGKPGLVSADLLRREQQGFKRQAGSSGSSKHLEDESQHAKTIFRDGLGRKRDLKQEQLEQRKRAGEKSEREEQYAKWGKGLAQSRQQQQNVEDAVKEMQKPLARYIDDQDLDKLLREQEREGDPMANFVRKKKAKERQDSKEKPKYNGPAPPLNRFNIWPGYRWDGVDRSNGFEKKRFARIASKKATQELAYKWSVEDM